MQQLNTIQQLYALYTQSYTVCTDTRNILPNSVFFALKGANFNGNTFAIDALSKGAAYAIVDETITTNDARVYKVENVLQTLQQLAQTVSCLTTFHYRPRLRIYFYRILLSHYEFLHYLKALYHKYYH